MSFKSAWDIGLRGSERHDAWVDVVDVEVVIERLPAWRLEHREAHRRILHHADGIVELVCAAGDQHGNYAVTGSGTRVNVLSLICWGRDHEEACLDLAKALAEALEWEASVDGFESQL